MARRGCAQATPTQCLAPRKALLPLKGKNQNRKLYSSLSVCSLHKTSSAFVTDTRWFLQFKMPTLIVSSTPKNPHKFFFRIVWKPVFAQFTGTFFFVLKISLKSENKTKTRKDSPVPGVGSQPPAHRCRRDPTPAPRVPRPRRALPDSSLGKEIWKENPCTCACQGTGGPAKRGRDACNEMLFRLRFLSRGCIFSTATSGHQNESDSAQEQR